MNVNKSDLHPDLSSFLKISKLTKVATGNSYGILWVFPQYWLRAEHVHTFFSFQLNGTDCYHRYVTAHIEYKSIEARNPLCHSTEKNTLSSYTACNSTGNQRMSKKVSKLIFSRSGYQKNLLGFCDICYNIINVEKTLYYKCQSCEDFIVCHHCMQDKRHRSHPVYHSFAIGTDVQDQTWVHMNLGITCDLCLQQNFPGKRYQCQSCLPSASFDVCSSCLPKVDLVHPKHKFVFIPNQVKLRLNRIILAKRAILLLKNSRSNGNERDDATGWKLSDAQRVLATDTAELERMVNAVVASNLSSSLSDELDSESLNTAMHQSNYEALVEELAASYLKNLQKQLLLLLLSLDEQSETRPETPTSLDSSASSNVDSWLENLMKQQNQRIQEEAEREEERRKEEEAEEDRIREERIRQKRIYDKIIRQKHERDYYVNKVHEDKRIREQFQTADRLAQERRTQQAIENQRAAQERQMEAIRAQQIRGNAIQQQVLEDARRQERIRQDAIRQQRR